MTSKEDQPQKKSQQGLLNLGDSLKAVTQVLNQTFASSSKSEQQLPQQKPSSILNLGDSLKDVTNSISQSVSKSSRVKIQEPQQEQEKKIENKPEKLNLGDSLKDISKLMNDSISNSSRSLNIPKSQNSTLNLGDSLKDVTKNMHESISKSSRVEAKEPVLNLGDSLKDVSKVIHESISQSSNDKMKKSETLNLGDPLKNATETIHDSIKNHSSGETSKNEEGQQKETIPNVLQNAAEIINESIQNESQTGTGKGHDSKNEDEKTKGEPSEKGQLEQYIEDNVLITILNSPKQKITAETQTDNTLTGEEEETHEEEIDEPSDDIPPITLTRFSQEELQQALQKQIATHELPPYEMREAVVDYARKQAIYKLMEEDYDKASKIDEAVAANLQSLRDDHHNIESDMMNSHLKQRLSDAERSKSSLQDEWKHRIRSFKENEETELQKINERHEQERRLFENHWSQAAILMPFSKPSSSLLQLRSMQKAFALSHDFANARALKISAERKQREESIEASKKAARSMRKEYITLIKRQQNEIVCFNENSNRKLGKLEAQRDFELKVNENVRSQLASRVNKSRNIKKPMVLIPSAPKVDTKTTSLAALTGTMTHRTRSQFANYRQSVEMKMLDVKIDDMKAIMKPLTPATQIGQKSKNQKKVKSKKT